MTATPFRADQMNGLITMQCGPVRHTIDAQDQMRREVITHETTFTTDDGPSIRAIYSELAANVERNAMIVQDIRNATEQGRTSLVLTNRLDHLDALANGVDGCKAQVFRLHGRLTAAERRQIRSDMRTADAAQSPFVLIAIDKIAREGLDLPSLNTLFLAVPVSFKGRVIQQLGRITHGRPGTSLPAVVHDYRDKDVPLLDRMSLRRRHGMAKEGFSASADL